MKSFDIILTRMRWNKPLWLIFNIGLFVWQFAFMVIGKWRGKFKLTFKQIWFYSQFCHVRLVLKPTKDWAWTKGFGSLTKDGWLCLSVTAPHALIENWNDSMIDNKNYYLLESNLDVTTEEIDSGYSYAVNLTNNKRARRYDWLQFLSFIVNLFLWIIWPPFWGKEKIITFNLPGGREQCSPGACATLRFAIKRIEIFNSYSTSMVSPCLYPISESWRLKNEGN